MNKIKLGFFSLSHHSPDGDDRAYLEWHQLDHMPEQYQLPGLVFGPALGFDPGLRSGTGGRGGRLGPDGPRRLLPDGQSARRDHRRVLHAGAGPGRDGPLLPVAPKQYLAGLRLLACPRRTARAHLRRSRPLPPQPGDLPHRRRATGDPGCRTSTSNACTPTCCPTLVSVPGVAGALAFGTTPAIRRPHLQPGVYRITSCYLDDDPATVGERLAPVLKEIWKDAPVRPVLAAPFESMMIWDWDRFGPAKG